MHAVNKIRDAGASVSEFLTELRPVIGEFRSLVGTSQDVADTANTVVGNLNPLIREVHSASQNVSQAAKDIGSFTKNASDVCVDVSSVMKPIRDALRTMGETSSKVNRVLDSLGNSLQEDTLTKTIFNNVTTHMVGIAANIVSLSRADSMMDVITSSLSIFSLIGIESRFTLAIIEKLQNSGNDGVSGDGDEDIRTTPEADWGKVAELFGSISGLMGKESFLPAFLSDWMKNATGVVRNVDSLKKICTLVEEVLAEFDINITERMKNLKKLKDTLSQVDALCSEMEVRFITHASDFMKDRHFKDFVKYERSVKELESYLDNKSLAELIPKGTQIKISRLAQTAKKQKQMISLLRAQCVSRPCPVGVVFEGESSIGKSKFTSEVIQRVKETLSYIAVSDDYEFAQDAADWTVWHENSSDNYDQGYVSQDIHVVDDAFQAADQSDHPSYIQKISTTPFLTYQAELENKGTPYRARLVVASCNQFPNQSSTVNDVDALRNRFPLFFRCVLRDGFELPDRGTSDYNPDFPWLQFFLLSKNRYDRPVEVSINRIVEMICRSLFQADKLHQTTLEYQKKRREKPPPPKSRCPIGSRRLEWGC